jgi:hypothetical protein
LLIELQLSAINALQDRHRDRQLVNAMHREMLFAVQVRRFARLEELGRDADAPCPRQRSLEPSFASQSGHDSARICDGLARILKRSTLTSSSSISSLDVT